jgi:hypothetical protein
MSTVGDKIGFTSATPGGDLDVWGATENALYTIFDEFLYAPREDRNLVVLGGGKIAWDGTDLTFTAAIEIRNHITAYKNSITTAASPRSLDASHKVAYASLTRKPASDGSITSLSLVAAGSLPNTTNDADQGIFVLAYRTTDSSLIFPWLKKELLSGDHFSIGAAQTWFERIASHSKPCYKSNIADNTQVKVPGSATSPACVFIDGKLYANTSDATCDVNTAGRNGLDTGTVAANTPYYLYAIPATSGRTFDVVCSVTAPSGAGPTGFSSWSYIGSFATLSGSAVLANFQAQNGIIQFNKELEIEAINSATRTIKTFSTMPTTAIRAYFQLSYTGTQVNNSGLVSGTDVSDDAAAITLQVSGVAVNQWNWVPILTAQTIWTHSGHASNTLASELYGWHENVMGYK